MRHSTELQDFEFEPMQPTTVMLSAAAVEWAVQICQQPDDGGQQWPTFLRAMALQGVRYWLEDGASALTLTYDQTQPPGLGTLAEVNGFRLCVVTQGSLSDGQVPIPQSSLDDAHGFAHLYILAEVKEEANQVTVLCGLRRDRLLAHHQQAHLTATAEGTYTLPVAFFDTLPDDILLYLNCLNPAQVAEVSPAVGRSPLAPPEPQINVGRWLQDQIDTLAGTVTNTLTWALLPPLSVSHAMMSAHSPAETLETVLRELEPAGVTIPAEARGAYTDLQPMGLPLRLYALTWTLMSDPQSDEWSLFLVLGPAPGEQMPPGTRLLVRDAAKTLADSAITATAHANHHLYAQVFGTWDEAFTVTVALPNGSTLNWPPFVFRPEE